jgi:hypothetical protein
MPEHGASLFHDPNVMTSSLCLHLIIAHVPIQYLKSFLTISIQNLV